MEYLDHDVYFFKQLSSSLKKLLGNNLVMAAITMRTAPRALSVLSPGLWALLSDL